MKRCHVYATAEEARDAIEAIDAARPPTEQATTYFGSRSTAAAIAAGLARRTRRGTLAVTGAGTAEGYAIEGGRVVRHHAIPARTWASVRDDGRGLVAGIPLADGTFAVVVCDAVAGADVAVRGETKRIPDDSTARTITRADVRREAEPVVDDGKGGR